MTNPDPDLQPYTWRMRLSNRLHLWAARIYDDFHTWEWTTSDGEKISFSCYWQYVGSWGPNVKERCSCTEEDLK